MAPPKTPVRTASPLLRAIFQYADENDIPIARIARDLRVDRHRLYDYRAGRSEPGVMRTEELIEKLGLDIKLEKRA